jgi:predicted ATP-grasp superfamily ATP-dependent carboligase
MPYRILRCAHASGCDVYGVGTAPAKGLAHSRFCKEFILLNRPINGTFDLELATEINEVIHARNIDHVLAADAPSTRTLIAIREHIHAPCFPMPDLHQFDLLNNKWKFGILCKSLAIPYPNSRIYSNKDQLVGDIKASKFPLPRLAKPLSMTDSAGIILLQPETALKQLDAINYRPILVQEFIGGEDVGASVYCSEGEVRAFILHKYIGGAYKTFVDESVYRNISKLMRHLNLSGVFNFDMRLAPDGRILFLECNPRFFYKIAMSMLAGINFVAVGLPGRQSGSRIPQSANIQFPKAWLKASLKPWTLDASSWDVLKFLLIDPIPWLRESWGFEAEEPEVEQCDDSFDFEENEIVQGSSAKFADQVR